MTGTRDVIMPKKHEMFSPYPLPIRAETIIGVLDERIKRKKCLEACKETLNAFTAPFVDSFEVNKFSKSTFATPIAKHEPWEKRSNRKQAKHE